MTNNTVAYPWEATVENPSMVAAGGGFYLAFSAGLYQSASYSEGITVCTGPLGPCGVDSQILTTYGGELGPGGGALFPDAQGNWWLDYAAWRGGAPGCTDYGCGAARQLMVAPIALPNVNGSVPCSAPSGPQGYAMASADGGVFNYGNLPYCGSEGGRYLNRRPILARARLVRIRAIMMSSEIAPSPSHNGLYGEANGMTEAAMPIVTYGSRIAVITWMTMKATDSREMLRCRLVVANLGSPGSRPRRVTRMPSSTTAVSSTSATTPVALLAYHRAVPETIPTTCLPMSPAAAVGRGLTHAGSVTGPWWRSGLPLRTF